MRTVNSFKNAFTGVGGQILTIVLQFLSRTVFIYTLGKEYLGISSLFTNILQVLSITELGIGTAIVYSLYQPLAKGDTEKVSAYINFLKKAYFFIGIIVGGVGLVLLPFLPYIMKETTDLVNINLIYILFLFQSVSSYWFFAYKSLLIKADQKSYIYNITKYVISIITVFMQILVLIIYKSFVIYTVIGIVSHIIINLAVSYKVDKLYPYLKRNKDISLSKPEKKAVFRNLYGVSMYKINSTIVRSTDSIVISSFVSTIAVGLYSNYYLIVSTLITMAKLFFSSFTASIGNLFVSENKEKSYFIFKCLRFLSFWSYGFAAICLWILFNPFITLWAGADYLFNRLIVFVIVIDFLMDGYQQVAISYKDATGLFWKGRYRPLATAILNVIISVSLAPRFGIPGVLLGTIISRLLTTWWFEPWMIHKYAFEKSSKDYFLEYFKFLSLVIVMGGIIEVLTIPFSEVSILNFIIKIIICTSIPNMIFYLLFRNKEEFIYLKDSLKTVLRRVIKIVRSRRG